VAKGRSTQQLVNTFPTWSNIRNDEQSLGFQLLNTVGQEIDDLLSQLDQANNNHFLSTSRVSDIDVFYIYELPGDYEFTKDDDDDTDFTYTPPTVSGVKDDVNYAVTIAEDNNIESFWYTNVPTRLSIGDTTSNAHMITSGPLTSSPFPVLTVSGWCHIPNHLTIKIEGGTSYLGLEDKNLVRKGLVQIEGLTREGLEVTEEIVFLHDETQQTIHEFKSIEPSGIRVYGVEDPDVAELVVTSANFNADDYPVNYPDIGATVEDESLPLFWSLASGVNSSIQTLALKKYDTDDPDLRMDGFATKSVLFKQEILDEGAGTITPLDLAVEPHSNRVWVVDSSKLYLYTSDLPYPDLSVLAPKDYQAESVIEPESYYVTKDDSVEINYVWRKPTNGIVAHRVWMIKPDGTKKSIESGVEVTYYSDSSSWIYGEPRTRKIREAEFHTLDQRGDYVFCLEVSYTDETTSLDKRVVSVLSQSALAEYDLSALITGVTIAGVDFDSEYKMWVLDSAGTKHEIVRHHDIMLIDFKRKVVYLRELYDQVRVMD
jgi:hypothetical protein